ncbi:AMP-binding protein [Yinghuangia sp. ASG 101]|uniref:class I adenylate-forming enzyme family protein n=1 Tax=Yinghuangia sp. ASG 101 TaxID=2896848 RepID=UPI001E28CD4A|nr:AMP-binding protein [Yinghuangia sp. ASG 101]UGQ11603.1 AMP-binding protein [Yinghuangia sp. ASG 101]
MGVGMVLDMAVSMFPDRTAVGSRDGGMTYAELAAAAAGGASVIREERVGHVVFVGVNGPALPVVTFAAALAGVPVAPLNYRLADDQLRDLIGQLASPIVVCDPAYRARLSACGVPVTETDEFVRRARTAPARDLPEVGDDETAVVLFTSGTTSAPKGVLLRHGNLVSYLIRTVEFGSAAEDDAALVSTPPYHIAGMGAVLSNVYSGRRMVHLPDFTPQGWLDLVRTEGVTSAMVVPTMLARVTDHLDGTPAGTPALRSLAYGGSRMPLPVLERALAAFPDTGFVNAYGLTETSSTIAVLGPDEHREALADPALRPRLASVGRLVPGVEGQIRDEEDRVLPDGEVGLLWVRGGQVSGEYLKEGSMLDDGGWFSTRDLARFEDDYLYIGGRADDTIIRGGENIAPAEIEDVIAAREDIGEVSVVGRPDDEWGERIVAVVAPRGGARIDPEELRTWCRERLRGSRTPDEVVVVDELPKTPTGKVLRRELVAGLTPA